MKGIGRTINRTHKELGIRSRRGTQKGVRKDDRIIIVVIELGAIEMYVRKRRGYIDLARPLIPPEDMRGIADYHVRMGIKEIIRVGRVHEQIPFGPVGHQCVN